MFKKSNQTMPRATMFADVIRIESLYRAWRKVRANRGAAGIDAVSLVTFAQRLEPNLKELSIALHSGAYQPLPARFVRILKANGKERELAILAVRDRIAQRAVLDALEPLIEPKLNDCNFAFRPHRSIEAAVLRLVAARANGYGWTFESDVQDFFGSIDRDLLMRDLSDVTDDKQILKLIALWLEAGEIEATKQSAAQTSTWRRKGRETLATARLLLQQSVTESLDAFLARQLNVDECWLTDNRVNDFKMLEATHDTDDDDYDGLTESPLESRRLQTHSLRRAALKQFVKNGALVALSQRALLGKIISPRVMIGGGLAAAAMLATPALRELYRARFQSSRGTLQGAPVSPLLTNLYMTPFDDELVKDEWCLIRYCDDFVIPCRTPAEAQAAQRAASKALKKRRLSLHPDKTRIVAPGEAFEFLGYRFQPDGAVIAPPSTPQRIADEINQVSIRAYRSTVATAATLKDSSLATTSNLFVKLKALFDKN